MMDYLVVSISLWFAAAVGLLVLLHGRTMLAVWREPVLARPILIVESDDWGPGPEADAEALESIRLVLEAVRDGVGRPPVMTLGVVCAVPDANAILSSGATHYARRTLGHPDFAPIVRAIRAGCDAGVFALQRHGLEHFWPSALLAQLNVGADAAQLTNWLHEGSVRSEDLPSHLQSRWVDVARLPSSPHDPDAIRRAVSEEVELLCAVFGFAPKVAVPNTFVWDDNVESAWAASGVRAIVTPGCRYEARLADGHLAPWARSIRNGEQGNGEILYLVRDVYFEPQRGHRAERAWNALADKIAQGRPTLLETHRSNFIGPVELRDASVAELERALRGALARHADLRFLSTEELARTLIDPSSPLLARDLWRRLLTWCARLRAEHGLARLLKFSGLGGLLRIIEYLLAGVIYRRPHDAFRC